MASDDFALPIERCPQFRDQPPGSTATYNGKCYIFYNRQPLNLRDALAFCRSRGGTLVDESNPALQGFISWELWRRHRSDTSSQYWMGAVRDPQDKMNWKWLNGDDVTISFWNLPGGNEDCARYDGSKGWLWSDTNCNIPINFICQHQPKTCGKPEQPPNSTMIAENFNVGSVIEYSCDEGHLLVGPNTRVCLPTGFYNEFPPVCKKVHCGYPADIPNGGYNLLNGTVGYLSQVMYYCNEGYKITGRALLTCDIDERWDGPPPRCQPVRCPDPPTILNGEAFISSNTSVAGTVIEFSCNRRFKLVGAKQIVCLPSGVYDNKPPVCKEDLRPPPGLSLGPVITPTKSSSTASPSTTPRERPRPFSTKPVSTVRPRPTPIPPLLPVPEIEDNNLSESGRVPNIAIASSHPTDNEIPDSVHVRNDLSYNAANVPVHSLEEDHKETLSSKFNNLGAIILLGLLGGLVFLAAVIVTVVILVRRNRSAKHYRHRPSPDCHTVASFDSSSSESRNGLNRYYQQAWENLHQSASNKAHGQGRRKEPMDSRLEGMRDGSELVVSDVATVYPHRVAGEKKRHHHHHHHHGGDRDWRHHHPSAKHRY